MEKLERRRSNLIDMGADGTIGREDLRAKLAEADEELRKLRNERAIMADRFRAMRGMGLRHLPPEERKTAYDALRLMAHVDEGDNVRITGVFDADLTELLPASWAVAKADAREYHPNLNVQLPTPHRGVVNVRHPHRGT